MKGCFPIVISIVYTDYVAVSKSAFQNVQLSFGRTTEHQVVAILSWKKPCQAEFELFGHICLFTFYCCLGPVLNQEPKCADWPWHCSTMCWCVWDVICGVNWWAMLKKQLQQNHSCIKSLGSICISQLQTYYTLTISSCPDSQARCSGVHPFLSVALTEDFLARSSATISLLPYLDALIIRRYEESPFFPCPWYLLMQCCLQSRL